MANSTLCSSRSAKRYCPAIAEQICAVCCGTKREVEIDCPSSCAYLKASRSYESEKAIRDPEVAARVRDSAAGFVERYPLILDSVIRAIIEEHIASKELVDNDAISVLEALKTTM